MASWVGAGWALNAGGIISRTVLGIKDEDGGAGYFYTATTLETRINNQDANLNAEISLGSIDGEPDLFSFNVGGYLQQIQLIVSHIPINSTNSK